MIKKVLNILSLLFATISFILMVFTKGLIARLTVSPTKLNTIYASYIDPVIWAYGYYESIITVIFNSLVIALLLLTLFIKREILFSIIFTLISIIAALVSLRIESESITPVVVVIFLLFALILQCIQRYIKQVNQ